MLFKIVMSVMSEMIEMSEMIVMSEMIEMLFIEYIGINI
jgi:hypothetical protein